MLEFIWQKKEIRHASLVGSKVHTQMTSEVLILASQINNTHACRHRMCSETRHESLCKCAPRCLCGDHVSYPIPATWWWTDRKWAAGRQEMDPRDTDWNFASGLCLFHCLLLCWFSSFQLTGRNTVTKYTFWIFPSGNIILPALFTTKVK